MTKKTPPPKKRIRKGAKGYDHPGRPLKFQNVQQFQKAVDAYFIECELEEDTRTYRHGRTMSWLDPDDAEAGVRNICIHCKRPIRDKYELPTIGCIQTGGRLKLKTPITVTGLCLAIGFLDTETLKNYGERDEFSGAVKRAYLRVVQAMEEKLHDDKTPPAKVIFGLSNFGWKNPQHVDHTTAGKELPAAQWQVVSYKGAVPPNDPV